MDDVGIWTVVVSVLVDVSGAAVVEVEVTNNVVEVVELLVVDLVVELVRDDESKT